ncbi:CDP-glycerol glycerophosphotransferase family protein, partial [Streptomyces sp. NPDC059956]|uniref:bifunctional glycosyltransferase/CDP-glycerol:glycerophosphate glycerophosphotransferase n=1 Tax=Streptomyces sp. NPDC059956 TaxID=3347015 RepID=UPI00365847D9
MSVPRLSVIVSAHGVHGSLRRSLESLLAQSYAGFEVVGVTGGEPDRSAEVLAAVAANDSRIQTVRAADPSDPGRWREAGGERATGEYLLFMDGRSVLLPGTLQRIVDRLAETADPDLLLFGHTTVPFLGTPRATRSLRRLAQLGDSPVCTLAELPELLGVTQVSWNRVVRRDLHHRALLPFEHRGPADDRLYALSTLASAASIALLPGPLLERSEQRPGPATGTGAPHPSAHVVEQYGSLFTHLRTLPTFQAAHTPIFATVSAHLLKSYAGLPPGARRPYAAAVAAFFRDHRPPGPLAHAGRGRRLRLLSHGRTTLLTVLDGALAARRGLLSLIRGARRRTRDTLIPSYYRLQRLLPLQDDLAVYSAYWGRGVKCNPAAICRKAAELAPGVRAVWVVSRKAVADLPTGIDHVVPGSRRYWSVMARATYFVNNVNFPDEVVKRRGQVHLMTHHGTPLKAMGVDQHLYPSSAKGQDLDALLIRADRWDVSLSPNAHTTETWARAYPCAARNLESGYPRNDVLLTATADQVLTARARFGIRPDQRALLYAPTFRDYERIPTLRLDVERVIRELAPETVLLVRAHYWQATGPASVPPGVVDVSAHPDIEDLYLG